jgi:hypothetical protein
MPVVLGPNDWTRWTEAPALISGRYACHTLARWLSARPRSRWHGASIFPQSPSGERNSAQMALVENGRIDADGNERE